MPPEVEAYGVLTTRLPGESLVGVFRVFTFVLKIVCFILEYSQLTEL